MMKSNKSLWTKAISFVLFLAIVCTGVSAEQLLWSKKTAAVSQVEAATAGEEVRGVWVSFYDYRSAGLYNKSKSTFTKNADTFFKKLKNDKINTVYFHVVPNNNAIYPSKYLKWCTSLARTKRTYDPLKILIDKAHANGIEFHAWVNPYRKTMYRVFDPGKASSLTRVLNIVNELLDNYDVDGIHFDDYFYPSKGRGKQLNSVSVSKRKKVINTMVKKVYKAVKAHDTNIEFGISPAGNVEYAQSIGCDLNTWMSQSGYVDYIIPQLYWSDQYRSGGKTVKMYTERLNRWVSMNKNNTPMYIGLGLYKAGYYSSTDKGWKKKSNNIVSQIKLERQKGCEGFVIFSSMNLSSSKAKKEMANYRKFMK